MTQSYVQQQQPTQTQTPQQKLNSAAAASAIELLKSKADYYIATLDKELEKQPYCHDLEQKTGVPKTYLVLGTGMAFFLLVFFNLGAKLLTNALSWIYPAYASFKAIESPATDDDTQWLTYWTVIGFAQMIEYFSDILLYWFPFYYTFKTLVLLWLILPQFRGAEVAYKRLLRPFLLKHQPEIERQSQKFTTTFSAYTNGGVQQ